MPLFPNDPLWGPWVTLTPEAGITAVTPIQLRKNTRGQVEARGLVSHAAPSFNATVIAAIPAEYAHAAAHYSRWTAPNGFAIGAGSILWGDSNAANLSLDLAGGVWTTV